ncbi:hypothetical protein BLNAU_21400 [Blattamonas nauphoetae]|uniref:Uncharacterized protein n=1 Tax=Blattamonas nauphoetae TaxID=2049346 RepID=A0ABQ9WW25_9EUKA|nr:hypothetical protein BLNAU_21400 [Blattamonas nauphoetae]
MLGDDDTLHLIDGEQHHRLPLVTFPVLQSTHSLAIALPYDVPATSCPQPYPAGQVAGAAPVQSAVVVKIEELTPTPPFSIPASSTVNVNKEMRSAEPQHTFQALFFLRARRNDANSASDEPCRAPIHTNGTRRKIVF